MFRRPSSRSVLSRRFLAAALAYLLAVQGLIVSIGLGMSAAAAADHIDFVICAPAAGHGAAAAPDGDRRNQTDHRPQCPFCFVAAQSGGLLATLGDPAAVPADIARDVSTLRYSFGSHRDFISPRFRSNGNPRAPPRLSV